MSIEVRPGSDRFATRAEGRTTWHSFSFGAHYDPHNIGFGALQAFNDELLPVGTGYPDHPHQNTEIVTLVLAGALRHIDSAGHTGVLGPGEVQVLSAGSGVVHSEVAEPGVPGPTRFLQAWVRPDESGLAPSYIGSEVALDASLTCLAAGAYRSHGLPLRSRGAALHAARLGPGEAVALPDAPRLHLFLAGGAARLDTGCGDGAVHDLGECDAARLVHEAGELTATAADTTVLAWTLP